MYSFSISVQNIQGLEDFPEDVTMNYSILINSNQLGTFKLEKYQNPISVPFTSVKDSIQILFYINDLKELYGCISFVAKQLIEPKQENIFQWVTLFDDPEDDLFDGRIGEEDEELPRAFLQVNVKQDRISLQLQDDSQINFEAGIKEKVQESNLQQTLELSSVACPRYEEPFPKSCDLSIVTAHNNRILESPEKSMAYMTSVSIEEMQIHLLEAKCPFALERKSSLESINQTEISLEDHIILNSENEINKVQQAGTRTTTGSMTGIESKNNIKSSLTGLSDTNVKDFNETLLSIKQKEYQEMSNNTKDNTPSFAQILSPNVEEENIVLRSRVEKLEEVIERLQRENNLRSQNEGVYALKISAMKIEADRLKKEKEIWEEKLSTAEILLTAEKLKRVQLEDQIKSLQHLETKNQNYSSNQDINSLKSQIKFDETIIQNLHEEIFSLRQKESENINLSNQLVIFQQKIEHYQEKFNSLVRSLSLFDVEETNLEVTEEFINKIYDCLVEKGKEMDELKSLNEDLTIRLSICDNKLLADSLLGQIESLKSSVNSFEKEREVFKEELTKANENYMSLTTKYVELSDFVATSKRSGQNEQNTSVSRPSTSNTKKSTKPKITQKNESVDDIEAKLIELTVFHKVQPSLLSRIDYGIYLYGGKRIQMKLQDGQLFVKVGEGYKTFQEFIKTKNTVNNTNNSAKPNPQNLKLLLKDINKEERSFDQKSRSRASNYHSVQVDQSQRDISSDFGTSSRSICKENSRSLVKQTPQTNSMVMDIKAGNVRTMTRLDRDQKLKEILTSRMFDRKLSYTLYGKKEKSQRDLTPL